MKIEYFLLYFLMHMQQRILLPILWHALAIERCPTIPEQSPPPIQNTGMSTFAGH